MRVDLQWAFCPGDMRPLPCALCEAEFVPKSIILRIEPHGYETCEKCLQSLNRRQEKGDVKADWPTWEDYQAAIREHPEPIFGSDEEAERSEAEDMFDAARTASWISWEGGL